MSVRTATPIHRGWRLLVAGAAASSLLLSACGGGGGEAEGEDAPEAQGGELTFATGGTGGVYYVYGGGIANVITNNLEGYSATAQETNASVDNMLLIQEGAADLALALGDVVADAVEGAGEFDGAPIDICSLGNLYDNFTQPITTTDSGITTVEDLSGRVVSVGAPGSATEVLATRIMEAAGLDAETDIDRRQLGVAETVAGLRDGTIDAGFWSGGLPTGALVDLASTGELALIPTAEYADALAEQYGDYYFAGEIPADTYQGQTEASPQIVAPNILVVASDMPEELQRSLTEVIFENKEELITVHPSAEELDPATAGDVDFIDTCPGAAAYFDEAAP